MSRLIYEAREKLEELRQSIKALNAIGIRRETEMGDKSSHIVVSYPPTQWLKQAKNVDFLNFIGKNALYVHIPFCFTICTYCAYTRKKVKPGDPAIDKYLTYLEREAGMLRRINGDMKIPVRSVYVGGGSPFMLDVRQTARLGQIIYENFHYDIFGVEYTREGHPFLITEEKIRAARPYGLNRISMGVESSDDKVLESRKRMHTSRDALNSIEVVRNAGIENIDVDFIRGFPEYSPEQMEKDVAFVVLAGIPSVNSNPYTLKPDSIDFKKRVKQLDQESQLLLHLIFRRGMHKLGYYENPVDWFIKNPSYEYKHQIQKWELMYNLIGVGQDAYSYVNGVQYRNFKYFEDYKSCLESEKLPIKVAERLSFEDIMRRRFIFGLKTSIDIGKFKGKYGSDPRDEPFKQTLEKLVEADAIEISDKSIELTEVGRLFADEIQMAFYSEGIRKLKKN